MCGGCGLARVGLSSTSSFSRLMARLLSLTILQTQTPNPNFLWECVLQLCWHVFQQSTVFPIKLCHHPSFFYPSLLKQMNQSVTHIQVTRKGVSPHFTFLMCLNDCRGEVSIMRAFEWAAFKLWMKAVFWKAFITIQDGWILPRFKRSQSSRSDAKCCYYIKTVFLYGKKQPSLTRNHDRLGCQRKLWGGKFFIPFCFV